MNEAQGIATFLNAAGVTGCLILFILGLRLEWWFLASHVKVLEKRIAQLERDNDRWQEGFLRATGAAEKIASAVAREKSE